MPYDGCMLERHIHKGLTWIDLESPTRDEIHQIVNEYNIRTAVAEELLMPSTRPRAEFHGHYGYLVLHFPALSHPHRHRELEIDFIIGRNFLITSRYDLIDPVHKFAKVFETSSVLAESNEEPHAGMVFYAMVKVLYRALDHELDHIRKRLAHIEDHIFRGEEVQMVESISHAARNLLNLRQALEPHREVLKSLETDAPALFGDDFLPYLRSLSNEYYRVHNHLMRQTESLRELRETNNSLLSTKQNETMKIFTIMAFMTFPLALMAVIFEMYTQHNTIIGPEYDFWIIFATLAGTAVIMYAFFKRKKWL